MSKALDTLIYGIKKIYAGGVEQATPASLSFPTGAVTQGLDADGRPTAIINIPEGGEGGSGVGGLTVDVVATSNVVESGLARTIDGVLCNDPTKIVLLTSQTDGRNNGPKFPRAGAWVRATGFETDADVVLGMGGKILRGTSWAGGDWSLSNTAAVTLGTTTLDFRLRPFTELTGHTNEVVTVVGGISTPGKVTNSHINDGTIALSKIVPGTNGFIAKMVAGVLTLAAQTGIVDALNEEGVARTQRDKITGAWLDVFDTGSAIQMRPHARVPRTRVRAIADTNITNSISTSFQSLTLVAGEVIYKGAQTTPSENGVYRVASVSGGVATLVKFSVLDTVIANTGLYVQAVEGTYGGTIRKFVGNGSLASAATMPAISPSYFAFDKIYTDDFVVAGDNISRTSGNWSPMADRARAAAYYGNAEIAYSNAITYRHTSTHYCWSVSYVVGNHVAYGLGGATGVGQRLLFDGAAAGGFYGVGLGGYTDYAGNVWDSGIRGGAHLRGLNVVFVNGANDNQFGVLSCGSTHIDHCVFQQPYGDGITIDSTIGAVGSNCNGWSISHTSVQTAGANGYIISGGDSNNGLMQDSRSSNHGQRDLTAVEYNPAGVTAYPGRDWGLLNKSFLGCTFIGCEFSSGHLGAVWDRQGGGSFSRYLGLYTEGGTTSDVQGSAVFAGNMVLRGTYISTPSASVTFANSGSADTATRAAGSWVTDGYVAGDTVTFAGSVSNNVSGVLASVTATVLTFTSATALTNEGPVTVSVIGSNPVSRVSVANPSPNQKLPLLKCLTSNVWAMSGLVCDDPIALSGRVAIGDNGMISLGLSGSAASSSWNIGIGTGGNSNMLSWGYGTLSAGVAMCLTLPGQAVYGAGRLVLRKPPLLGDPAVGAIGVFYTTDATALPATGVPDTSPTTALSGAQPVGTIFLCEPGGPRLARRVLTNSGSAAYNLAYEAIANPSAPRVTLAMTTATIAWNQGGKRIIAASASAAAVITLDATTGGATGALKGDQIVIEVKPQSVGTVTIKNGGSGGTGVQADKVLAINVEYRVVAQFDGTDWTFQAWACI